MKRQALGILMMTVLMIARPLQVRAETLLGTSHPEQPPWVTSPPAPTSDWLYFTGSAYKVSTIEAGQEAAYKQATSQIARTVNLALYEKYLARTTSSQGETGQNVISETQTRTQAEIHGAVVRNIYWEKYRVWKYWGPITYNVFVLLAFPKIEYLQERERQQNLSEDYQNKISDLAQRILGLIHKTPIAIQGFRETTSGKRYAFSRILESDLKSRIEGSGGHVSPYPTGISWALSGDYRAQAGQIVITATLKGPEDKTAALIATIDRGSVEDAWLKQEIVEDTEFFLRHEEERKSLAQTPRSRLEKVFSGIEAQGAEKHLILYFNYLTFSKFHYEQQTTDIEFPPTAIVSTSRTDIGSGLGGGLEYQWSYTPRVFIPLGAEVDSLPNNGLLNFTTVHAFTGTGLRISRNLSVAGTVGYARWGFNFDAANIKVAAGNSFPLRLTARYTILDSALLSLGYQLWKINPPSQVIARQYDNGRGNGGTITDTFRFGNISLNGGWISLGMFF